MQSQMTGPEHFRAGEDLLSRARRLDPLDEGSARLIKAHVAEAQAHFTAAQALAAAIPASGAGSWSIEEDERVANGWAALLGMKVAGE